ncbi:hypothetical protein ACH4PU_25780 [Streptomyces sp. NPDC021100]|uniref:hypothetical protein n=1 Tax=Streptomyces sp. NPDC021100 TaxID=3365114 RepID=UPI0037887B87
MSDAFGGAMVPDAAEAAMELATLVVGKGVGGTITQDMMDKAQQVQQASGK